MNKAALFGIIGTLLVLIGGVGFMMFKSQPQSVTNQPQIQVVQTNQNQPSQTQSATQSGITLTTIAIHATSADCWMAVDGQVYDVTKYIPSHPGGDKIVNGCGKDASQMFAAIKKHGSTAREQLKNYLIGTLSAQ